MNIPPTCLFLGRSVLYLLRILTKKLKISADIHLNSD